MIKNIFAIIFLAVSLSMVRAVDIDFDDGRNLKNCDKTCDNNPCKKGGKQLYFEHCRRRMFIQCDEHGKCFEERCKKGTRWNQEFQACVHRSCGDCKNNCNAQDVAAGKLYSNHCTDKKKFRQCDKFGGCFVMDCPPGTVWKNKKNACVHVYE